MFSFLKFLAVILVFLSVAFFTLLERKVLGYGHNRLGPNKLGLLGVFQPFSDALKLFTKCDLLLGALSKYVFFLSPLLGFFLTTLMWVVFCFWGFIIFLNFSFIYFICLSGLMVYFLLFSGWSSLSKYSLLGSYRSSSQSVSYEVVMILSVLCLCFFFCQMSFSLFYYFYSMMLVWLGLFICWFVSCVAESNRTPFDFSEGESELVSGFNTEYQGGLFSLIFISEYSSIIFLSFLSGSIFFGGSLFWFMGLFFMFIYLWVRASFPRMRYDILLYLSWKGLSFYILGLFIYL